MRASQLYRRVIWTVIFCGAMIARSRASEVVEAFQRAVVAEDALNYTEPPSWFPPVPAPREKLFPRRLRGRLLATLDPEAGEIASLFTRTRSRRKIDNTKPGRSISSCAN